MHHHAIKTELQKKLLSVRSLGKSGFFQSNANTPKGAFRAHRLTKIPCCRKNWLAKFLNEV